MICANKKCASEFPQKFTFQRFCSEKCRITTYHTAGLTPEMRRPPRRKRPARCHWCRGPHVSDSCPNRAGKSVRQFGTVDPVTRDYIPPPGVQVRVLHISNNVHSETLATILKEIEP